MSNGQTTEGIYRLVVQGLPDLEKMVKIFIEATGAEGDFSKETKSSIDRIKELTGAARTLNEQMGLANKSLGTAPLTDAAAKWTILKDRVEVARKEYVAFNQAQLATGQKIATPQQFLGSTANTGAVTAKDLAAFQQGSSISLFDDSAQKLNSTLPRIRYALYDVALTAGITSTAITALGAGAIKASTQFDRAFADVRRTMDDTSDGSAAKLKAQLIDLTRQIPQTFTDVAKIATLGNQLGVPEQGLVKFTDTIAKFSTVSGIAPDEAAKSFGSLGTILGFTANQYSNFASSVELVGRKSAATDADILSMTKDIGQQAKQAGFNADQVVALSGAMAQLRIAPERARGSLTTYFSTLNKAVAEGGSKLQAFSVVTGITADKLSDLVRSGKGVEVFQAFLNGLKNQGDVVNVTKALDALGLSQLRVTDAFQRLSTNQQVFTQYMGLAKQGYEQNTELNRQYAIVLDTVAAKWQLFLNALQEFAATVGTELGPSIGQLLGFLTDVLHTLNDFAKTPFGKFVTSMVVGIGGLVAGLSAMLGVSALAAASLLAVRDGVVAITAAAVGSTGGVTGFIAALFGLNTAAETASIGLKLLRTAEILTGFGAVAVIIGYVILLFTDFGSAMRTIQEPINLFIDEVGVAASVVLGLAASVVRAASAISGFIGGLPGAGLFKDWAKGLSDAANELDGINSVVPTVIGQFHQGYNQWVADQQKVQDSTDPTIGATNQYGTSVDALNKKLQDNLNASNAAVLGSNKVGSSAKSAATQVRTLVDYANDLTGVFSRAFDIRFGGQQGIDQIASQWQKIGSAISDAKKQISDLAAKQQSLAADKSVKEYWLSIANQYGDTVRATSLKSDISDINSQMSANSKDIADAQAKASTALTGGSAAAIANRGSIEDLVKSYEDLIGKYAASGLSQDQLKQKVDQLKQQFIQQATQLGFSRGEVSKYTGAFDDMATAIGKVPRTITVRANTNPALQALAEFQAKLDKAAKGITVPVKTSVDNNSLAKFARGQSIVAQISALQGSLASMTSASTDSQVSRKYALQQQIDALTKKINSGNYYTGGYTGPGGQYDIAGNVHRGEFVFNKQATDFYGPSFLNKAMLAGQAGSRGGGGSGASGYMRLHPADMATIARMIGQAVPDPSISAYGMAGAVNAAHMTDNRLGRY